MKDHKDQPLSPEPQSYQDKLEKGTPTQVSQSIIAQILLIIKKKKPKP